LAKAISTTGDPSVRGDRDSLQGIEDRWRPVFRGFEGYGETAEIHRHHLTRKNQPIVVTIEDTPENLGCLIPEAEEMTDNGMIATSNTEYVRTEKPPTAADLIRTAGRSHEHQEILYTISHYVAIT
jgi:hypothetical protein